MFYEIQWLWKLLTSKSPTHDDPMLLAEEGFYLQQQQENSISVQADLCSGY